MHRKEVPYFVVLAVFLLTLLPLTDAKKFREPLDSPPGSYDLTILYFHGRECSNCARFTPFAEDVLKKEFPNVGWKTYEIWHNDTNKQFYEETMEKYNVTIRGTPTLLIGEEVVVGFRNPRADGPKLRALINKALGKEIKQEDLNTLSLPFVGKVDPKKMSLPLFTIIIAGLDGFNPCAMWVLMFLLSLLIHAKSRKKILLIGGIFVFISGFIYFLFMVAWFNFFKVVGFKSSIRYILGLVALTAGAINIKEFFWFKRGVSLTISEGVKPGIFARMRLIVQEQRMGAMVIGTIILAVLVNFYELLCTAGFPAIYSKVIADQQLPTVGKYFWLLMYNLIYVIPLAIIVIIFAVTMGSRRFTERGGRFMKLIGGLFMLAIALILIFNPELLAFV